MRLWHKELISSLPKNQLVGQWRECCAIAKALNEQGSPNHLLVNKILNYPKEHFYTYCSLIMQEMKKRGYNVSNKAYNNFIKNIGTTGFTEVYFNELFKDWHNQRYLTQCYYNLQEKYDCGGISKKEWTRIEEKSLYIFK